MINIEYTPELSEEFYELIDAEFNKFATKNSVTCNYTPFNFIAKEDNKVVGIITGHSYYKEVHIGDLIVFCCTFAFTMQIICIDKFADRVDGDICYFTRAVLGG